MKRVRLSVAAQRELQEAQEWYSSKSDSAREKFIAAFKIAAELVQRNPALYPMFYKSYRKKVFRGFPCCSFIAKLRTPSRS